VVLGTLPSDTRLGGELKLDRGAAATAVGKIATALNISLEDAAASILDIVNENMYGALRLVSLEQGYDPKDFALVAFGGAGPLHANAVAKLLQSWPVIVPRSPGVLSAYGDVTTRVRQESSRTLVRQFSDLDLAEMNAVFGGLTGMWTPNWTVRASPARSGTSPGKPTSDTRGNPTPSPIPIADDELTPRDCFASRSDSTRRTSSSTPFA
jgi:N-methylhydantoinase A